MKKITDKIFFLSLLCLFVHCAQQKQIQDYIDLLTMRNPSATSMVTIVGTVADTGQTQCSTGASGDGIMGSCDATTSPVAGQDGSYVNVPNARSFTGPTTRSGFVNDFITKDNVTGLTWKSCSEGLSGPSCTIGAVSTFGWATASTTCTVLNAGAGYAGLTNWRLPTIEELQTLPNFSETNPSINSSEFPATEPTSYWSSSTYQPASANAWVVVFFSGRLLNTAKTTNRAVRCVSGQALTVGPYSDNGDGTVTDQSTKLVWQKFNLTCLSATWINILNCCQNLNLAGRAWRLPNINELSTLADRSRSNPAINVINFPATSAGDYWTSSTSVSNTLRAWTVNFDDGGSADLDSKSSAEFARCVSGP